MRFYFVGIKIPKQTNASQQKISLPNEKLIINLIYYINNYI